MKKTREERQAFLDRIEKKYKEKLLLQKYKAESKRLHQQLAALRGATTQEVYEEDLELLDTSNFRPTYS